MSGAGPALPAAVEADRAGQGWGTPDKAGLARMGCTGWLRPGMYSLAGWFVAVLRFATSLGCFLARF